MKSCVGCKYAEWKTTTTGRLHPSGDGKCTYQYKVPPLPGCMYFIHDPKPIGGDINRREELMSHCPYFDRK